MRTILIAVLAAAQALSLAAPIRAAENSVPGEVVDRTALRVCADPADLPFSNEAEEGFENEIAQLLGRHFDLPVTYIWYPNTIGFFRQTLRDRLCDLVMGVVSANELVQNTNPYYRSTYVLAVRGEDADDLGNIDSPLLTRATIGVVAGTPPADMLARRNLLGNVRPYQLRRDSRYDSGLKQMADDLAEGVIDVALGWGPPLAYWAAQHEGADIQILALKSDHVALRTDFRISMGVRWNEPDWKHDINNAIAELQPEITAIMQRYHIPLLDDDGNLISGTAEVSVDRDSKVAHFRQAEESVLLPAAEELRGYRTERYRGAVPATLDGGTVVDTAALQALIADANPLLIDVLPKEPKPPGRDEVAMPWMERKREHIEGSYWLPNIGYGDLNAEMATFLDETLAELTGGDVDLPLVFYCDANCWMSYNAAKRAIHELDYDHVYWYPAGVDGWRAAGLALVESDDSRLMELEAAP